MVVVVECFRTEGKEVGTWSPNVHLGDRHNEGGKGNIEQQVGHD